MASNTEKDLALATLQRLRENGKLSGFLAACIRHHASNGGFTLAEVGTNEEELEQLCMNEPLVYAKEDLATLRADPKAHPATTYSIYRALETKRFSLADIGTNEEEFRALQAKAWRSHAREKLDELRRSHYQAKGKASYIHELASKFDFALADIGTNEEELRGFLREDLKTVAQHYLEKFHAQTDGEARNVFADIIRGLIREDGFSLADIGTNEEELRA